MSTECSNDTISLIKTIVEKCEFVRANCDYTFIDFYSLNYCYFDGCIWYTIPVLIITGLLCFWLLSDTSNTYLSTALAKISDKLNISQNLAGLTFVAFGNGAPDVISSIVASGSELGGIEFALGALMGAGVFVTSVVLSCVVHFSTTGYVKVIKTKFVRDIILYLLTLVLLCVFSYDGKITLWESIVFFLLYLLYVIVAVIQDKCGKKKPIEEPNGNTELDEQFATDLEIEVFHHEHRKSRKQSSSANSAQGNTSSMLCVGVNGITIDNIRRSTHFKNSNDDNLDDLLINPANCDETKRINKTNGMLKYRYEAIKYKMKKIYFNNREKDWDKKNIFLKIFFFLIDFPLTFLRDLTIPPCELIRWNRYVFVLMPISCFLLITLATNYFTFFISSWTIGLPVAVALLTLSIILSLVTYRSKLPSYEYLLCIGNFCMSIFWIWLTSSVLVDTLNVVGVLFNLPASFLGMTLLAFGNSLPDLTVNCALSKASYAEMGVAGSIAGPLFNVLFGLGISLIKTNLANGDIKFNFFAFDQRTNLVLFVSFVALGLNLLSLLIQSFCLNFKLRVSVAYTGYVLYIIFFIAICYFTFQF